MTALMSRHNQRAPVYGKTSPANPPKSLSTIFNSFHSTPAQVAPLSTAASCQVEWGLNTAPSTCLPTTPASTAESTDTAPDPETVTIPHPENPPCRQHDFSIIVRIHSPEQDSISLCLPGDWLHVSAEDGTEAQGKQRQAIQKALEHSLNQIANGLMAPHPSLLDKSVWVVFDTDELLEKLGPLLPKGFEGISEQTVDTGAILRGLLGGVSIAVSFTLYRRNEFIMRLLTKRNP